MNSKNKLINILIISIIIFFIYNTKNLYTDIFVMIKKIVLPLVLSFFFSWSLYPIYKRLNIKLNKYISLFIIIILFLLVLFLLLYYTIPLIYKELSILNEYKNIKIIINIKNYLYSLLNIKLITRSIEYISQAFFIIFLTIYILLNFEKIINIIKNKLSKKYYELFDKIYKDLNNYFKGFYLLIFIETIEYLIIYLLIGHPLSLLLAILSGITTIIPYIGALLTNLLALVSAISISKTLFIKTSIVMILIPLFNSYIIDPKIYSNTVKIPVLNIIISMIVFSTIFKIYGIIFSIPLYIIIKNFIKFLFPNIDKL